MAENMKNVLIADQKMDKINVFKGKWNTLNHITFQLNYFALQTFES